MEVIIRPLSTMKDMQECVQLQVRVWGLKPEDAVPDHFLKTIPIIGGIIIGAFDNDQLIGFFFAVPRLMPENKTSQYHAHMMGVDPHVRHKGVGFELFKYGAAELRTNADRYDVAPIVSWTYDPWLGANAHLYLHKAGAVATSYFPNMYGEQENELYAGLRTDRFEVTWCPFDQDVISKMAGTTEIYSLTPQQEVNQLQIENSIPRVSKVKLGLTSEILAIRIPRDFTALKQLDMTVASEWQEEIGAAFEHYFGQGYEAIDFVQDHEAPTASSLYILKQNK